MVTTGDTGTVTNTMLAGSIANAKLTNSSVTVGSTSIALGATSTTLDGVNIGATTPGTGAFTTLSASSTVSGTGFSTYLASPPAIGGTAAAAGSFTTLAASSTVSGTGFSTYLASPPAIGGTAAAAGTFTALSGTTSVTTPIVKSASSLTLQTNGTTTAVTVDTSQNVGIGTASPTARLHSYATSGTTTTIGRFEAAIGSYTGTSLIAANTLGNASTYNLFSCITDSDGDAGGPFTQFLVRGDGNVLVGTTVDLKAPLTVNKAPGSSAYGQIAAVSLAASDVNNAGMSVTKYDNVTTTSQVLFRFLVNQGGTASGQINANGASAAAFGSYSDSRLKQNIVDLPSQLANIMALRPVEYDYIESEGGGHQIGFVAQEVQAIYPDLVGQREDGMLTLTDMNKNDARLIKAIQELTARVAALEAK
jgi:hypothetical protein